MAYVNPQTIKDGLLTGDRDQGYIWRAWRFLDGDPEGSIAEDDPFASPASFWRWPPTRDRKKKACAEPPPAPPLRRELR